MVGISLTRTITGAVHNLYEGTQKVSHGDFSHRIAVDGKDQLAELGTSFNQMTANLERLIVVEKEKERLQSELEIAREVQTQLFPKESPGAADGAAYWASAIRRAWCRAIITISDRCRIPTLALAIGDVAGKGISAALLMAAIQSTMRTQLAAGASMAAAAGNGRRAVQSLHGDAWSRSSTAALRQHLAGKVRHLLLRPVRRNAQRADVHQRRTSAAHADARGRAVAELEVTGTVVGAFPFSRYEEQEIELRGGDLLVAYTDGVVEPENPYGEQFGEDRLKDLLVKYEAQESSEIIARVMEAVEQWTGSAELQDDMTMLVVRRI